MTTERAPRLPIWLVCSSLAGLMTPGQRNEVLVAGRARFEIVAAEENRCAGVWMRVGGECMVTVMLRDRNYECPGFDDVKAIAEGGGLKRARLQLHGLLSGQQGAIKLAL
jgi:hypothetical protein